MSVIVGLSIQIMRGQQSLYGMPEGPKLFSPRATAMRPNIFLRIKSATIKKFFKWQHEEDTPTSFTSEIYTSTYTQFKGFHLF